MNFEEFDNSGSSWEEFPLNFVAKCIQGHTFCFECMNKNAANLQIMGKFSFECLDVTGCRAKFSTVEVDRFLSRNSITSDNTWPAETSPKVQIQWN